MTLVFETGNDVIRLLDPVNGQEMSASSILVPVGKSERHESN